MDYYKGTIPILDFDSAADRAALYPMHASFGHDPSQVVKEMYAHPSEMELIPESEWDARYDEAEAKQSSLEHIYLSGPGGDPAFTNLDQNGHGYCVTADTEVLTGRGWVAYPDYDWRSPLATVNQQTHALEFQMPFQRHVYEYDGPMIYSTNRRVDFGVTPDHQMYVRKWDERRRKLSPNYSFVRAGDMGWYAGLLHAPSGQIGTEFVEIEVPGDRRYDGDDFLAVLGLIVSDGYAGGSDSTRYWVSFASFREGTLEAVRALAARTGFREKPSQPGVFIRYDAGAFAAWLRENIYVGGKTGAHAKCVPTLVKCASPRQIKQFLHWFDDRNRDSSQFYSSSKRLVDDLQELHLRIGKRSHIGDAPAKTSRIGDKIIQSKSGYILTVGDVDRLCIDRKKHIETERYKGLVYCAAVPNHTLLTRRNGSVLISSNCWAYSVGHSIMMRRLADGQPLIRLNPHSVAAIIKGGRDEGGWCGLSAKFVREHGMAEEGTGEGQWPLHSRRLQYDTPECRNRMARYKTIEEWVDLTRSVYEQNLTVKQLATALFNNLPGPVDFNHWSHSVCAIRWVRIESGSWGLLILNSWAGWGRHGLGVLRGNKAIPDGALTVRAVRAAA